MTQQVHFWVYIWKRIETLIQRDVCVCVSAQSFSPVWFFVTPWAVAYQVPISMEFSEQEYWSGLPFPPPGDLLDPKIEDASSMSPSLASRLFTTKPPGDTIIQGGTYTLMLTATLFKLAHSCTHFAYSNVMLKILQARFQQYDNGECPDVQARFRKGKQTRNQSAIIRWIIERAREFQKNSTSALFTMLKLWLCGSQQTAENSSRDEIPDHLTCLLRNLCAEPNMEQWLVPNWKRSTSRLYIVTLLI